MPSTLLEKFWQRHLVDEDGQSLLYVVRQLVYEVTSPQAFEGLRGARRQAWRRETVIATADHNVPTQAAERSSNDAITERLSRTQVKQLSSNCLEFGITEFALTVRRQGIIPHRFYEHRRLQQEPWLFG